MKKTQMMEELRAKTDEELLAHKDELKRDIFVLMGTSATSGEKRGVQKRMFTAKRRIARVLTIIRERELQQQFQKPRI